MVPDHDAAVETAAAYAAHEAEVALTHLLRLLGIPRERGDLPAAVAPFAPVWAAMISAAAAGHWTLARSLDCPAVKR